jgi:hypothetical protein
LKVHIDTFDNGLRLRVDLEPTDPQSTEWAVQASGDVFHEYASTPVWDIENSPQSGRQSFRRSVHGPWAADAVLSWARRLPGDIAWYVEYDRLVAAGQRVKAVDRDALTPFPVAWLYEGQQHDFPALNAALSGIDAVHAVGTFELGSNILRVTDPVYPKDAEGAGTFAAAAGTWSVSVLVGPTSWRRRVKQLRIRHADTPPAVFDDLTTFSRLETVADVDSGQCGFFDDTRYPVEPEQFECEDGTFYDQCCQITGDLQLQGAAALHEGFGAVARSGFGDGSYEVLVVRNEQDQVVAACLLFIDELESDKPEWAT